MKKNFNQKMTILVNGGAIAFSGFAVVIASNKVIGEHVNNGEKITKENFKKEIAKTFAESWMLTAGAVTLWQGLYIMSQAFKIENPR